MRTSEALGNVDGSQPGQGKAEGIAQEIIPVEITFDKTNTIEIGINGRNGPVLVDAEIIVFTGFDAAGTDLISVGSAPAGTNLFNGQTVAAPGKFVAAAPILIEDDYEKIEIAYAFTSTAPTAGRAIVLLKVTPLKPLIQQEE